MTRSTGWDGGRPLALVGFMGAGKTTVGELVAAALGRRFVDLDREVESRAGCTVRELFVRQGEGAFRELEHRTAVALLDDPTVVVALGGGAVEDERTRRALASADVVYLHVEHHEAIARVGADTARPLLVRPDLATLHADRAERYAAAATVTVPTTGVAPEAVAAAVVAALAGSRRTG